MCPIPNSSLANIDAERTSKAELIAVNTELLKFDTTAVVPTGNKSKQCSQYVGLSID